MKKPILSLLILFLACVEIYADTIRGIIKDANGIPIVSVQVSLIGKVSKLTVTAMDFGR